MCVSFAVIYFFGYSNLLLLFRFLIILRKRLDKFHYYTEWNCNSLFLICLFVCFFCIFFFGTLITRLEFSFILLLLTLLSNK